MDELGTIEEGVDWTTHLGLDIRNRVTHDIWQMKLQTTTSTTLIDLQKVAARIEERIYKIAIDFGDYLRRISLMKRDLDDSYPMLLNNFLQIHQQASTPSFVLLHQKNKQGQIIQAEGNVQETSSSRGGAHSVLSQWWVNKWTCLQSIKLDINWFCLDREKFGSSIDKLLLSRDNLDAPMDIF
uniref:Mediator complex subunit 15 KIX domain-containing protein n=1 Tax=Oryza punctata TaxID=4537 RepID=A0A0E0LUF6_ORYPU